MGEVIADLQADISADTSKFESGLASVKGALGNFANVLSGAAIGALGVFIFAASNAQTSTAQLDAVLKSTESHMAAATKTTGYWVDGTAQASRLTAKYGDDLVMAKAHLADMNDKLAAGGKLSHVQQANYDKLSGSVNKMEGEIKSATNAHKHWVSTLQQATEISHLTREQYLKLATALQGVTRYSKETVLSAENMLLTFTSIGKEVFPQATETALNMATALGTDASQAAMQLGKALNNPIQGLTALRRVGVQFTAAQETLIKSLVASGKTMEAQKVILGELDTEFGNSARAAGDTFAGKLDIVKNKFGDLLEKLGSPILDALSPVLDGISSALTYLAGELDKADPATVQFGLGVTALIASIPILTAVFGAFGAVLGIVLSPIGLVVAAIVAVGLAIGVAVKAFAGLPAVKGIIQDIYKTVKPALDELGAGFKKFWDTLNPNTTPQTNALNEALGKATKGKQTNADDAGLQTQGQDFGTRFSKAIDTAWPMIQKALQHLFQLLSQWFLNEGKTKLTESMAVMGAAIVNWFTSNPLDSQVTKWVTTALTWINTSGVTLASAAGKALSDALGVPLGAISGAITGAVKSALIALANALMGSGIPGIYDIGAGLLVLSGKFATGGLATAGQAYLVGEHGPEVFMPQVSGRVMPNSHVASSSSSGGNTITIQTLILQGVQNAQDLYDSIALEAKRRNIAARAM